jgi:hypothetical protein
MSKIYVAGKWQEKDSVRQVMSILVKLGHTITYDWTQHDDADDSYECALADLNGVAEANYIVVIADKLLSYRGVFVEIGAALALNKPVYIIGDGLIGCVFLSLCHELHNLKELP